MNFPERLMDLINEKGITKHKLQMDLNLNKSSILNWTQRGNIPSGDILKIVADYLGVSTDYLLGNTDERTNKKAAVKDSGLSELDLKYIAMFHSLPPEEQKRLLELGELLLLKQRQSQQK